MTNHSSLGPAPFLAENTEILPKGRALDVAMGAGRNTIYLAKMGFDVEGVDISTESVNSAIESAQKAGVTIKTKVADLESDYHIEKGIYDVIICFNYLQRSLIAQIKDGLRQGGMAVYESFLIDQAHIGKPKNPDYLLRHNELIDIFRDFRCLRYREGLIENKGDRSAIASIIAEKV